MDIPQKIGRYEILGELGHGAMGIVYRAKDPAMDRVVALKTIISVALASQQGSEFRERFYREARAAGALTHPGIVPVFDVGEHEGTPFLVMEFVAGRTLDDVAKKGERLKLDRVCEIGQKIAEALGYAHQHGVVHRDIKPSNILLTSRETYGIERPKISDFGLAKLAEGQTTLTGQMLGTPAFMPPEQFTGAQIDGRADIFSLGVMLYLMATGEQPFPGESITAVSYKVVHTDPVPPGKLNPSLPAKLELVILKCLAKNPAERYQTGEDLARDLGELRTGDKSATLQTAPPAAAGRDPDATVYDSTLMVPAGPVAATRTPGRAVAPKGKRDSRLVVVAAILAVLAAGGWYALRSPQKSALQAVVPPAAAVTVAPVPAPAETEVPKDVPKEVTGAAEVAPEPAALGFDPKALDPKQNARLKIDAERMPAGLDFAVEMNGRLYLRKTGAGGYGQDVGFFVPPGVQEFRVTSRSGVVEKASNTVSTEFKAKKRNTLKIELRTQGMPPGAAVPQGLYPDTQIVVTLK